MIAPDGTTGDVPNSSVQKATSAGFKQAVAMTSPDGKLGYVPFDRASDARNAGFKTSPTGNTSNVGTQTGAFSSDAGTPVNLVTGEGGLQAAQRQAQQSIGGQAEQMKGIPQGLAGMLPGIMAHAPQSIAAEKQGEDALSSPVPSSQNPVNIPQNMRPMMKVDEQIPGVAAAASAFAPVEALPAAADAINQARPTVKMAQAGQQFQDLKGAIGGHTVSMTNAMADALADIKGAVDTGSTLPSVVNKFVTRIADTDQGPLTYQEARQFYHNISDLSASEKMATKAGDLRLLNNFKHALGDSIANTADAAGRLQDYQSAMKGFASGAQGLDKYKMAKDFVLQKAVPAATAGAIGYGTLQSLKDFLSK